MRQQSIGLRALFDLDQIVGDQAVRFAVHRDCGFFVGRLDQAENLARPFVKPVMLVVDVVFSLGLQIGLMRVRDAVIWATGYSLDFSWVELPIFDARGEPIQRRGLTAARGIYFLGLKRQHTLKSSLLCGVGEDAAYLAQQM